jgi:pSer/pThr/pTyr-binding forkhead associated (FHA) protein
MTEKKLPAKTQFSPDWLLRGVLTKIGETFDRLTGRNWKPSSSLATSELIERLKNLLDAEVEDLGVKGKFVPHNIKLKMQWDKFSTDENTSLKALETELLTAAIDHINDNLYHTYAPLQLEVKPDYFTEGVKLLVSFDKFADEEREAEIKVSLPEMKAGELMPKEISNSLSETYIVRYKLNQTPKEIRLTFAEKRRLSVGRTKENDLTIEDTSISKIHAALVLNEENQLLVADTGSTNGTFINDERIGYGKAYPILPGANVKFGTIAVSFEYVAKPIEPPKSEGLPQTNSVEINGFEFRSKTEMSSKSEVKIEDRATETMTLEPIEQSAGDGKISDTRQGINLEFEDKNDSPE